MMKRILYLIVAPLMALFLMTGCGNPTPNPIASWHPLDIDKLNDNKQICGDYKDYLQRLPNAQQGNIGIIGYFKGGDGQHAVSIQIFEKNENASWQHTLIYDQQNKRIKAVIHGYLRLQS
jgi:hypothetical protein